MIFAAPWLLVPFGLSVGSLWWFRFRTVREHRVESIYQTVHVERRGPVRFLHFDSRSWQGAVHLREPQRILFSYQKGFLLFPCFVPEVRSFLAIGVGTGTGLGTVRRFFPDAMLYGVDIDAEVIRVAHQFFDCPDDDNTCYVAVDGRRFLEDWHAWGREEDLPLNLIFLDAYADDRIPARLETIEFVRSMKERLAPEGAVFVNVIGSLRGEGSRYLRRVWRTYHELFRHVVLVPTSPFSRESQNILLIATDAALPSRKKMWEQVRATPLTDPHKRKLLRLIGRLTLDPPWSPDDDIPLTDEDVRLLRHRITR
jgi:spermidine synthase